MTFIDIVLIIIGAIISYLIGSIPFGFIIAKLAKNIDIRQFGSGNVGATNVFRVVGKKEGIIAFILDVTKGFVAAFVISRIVTMFIPTGYPLLLTFLTIGYGMAVIIGHIWTIFLGFKGGKGVATSLGVVIGIAPMATLLAFGVWIVVFVISRYVSLGSLCAAAALPLFVILFNKNAFGEQLPVTIFCMVIAILVIVRHVSNIRRLIAGTENRFSVTRTSSKDTNQAEQ